MFKMCVIVDEWSSPTITKGDVVRLMHMCKVLGRPPRDYIWDMSVKAYGQERLQVQGTK